MTPDLKKKKNSVNYATPKKIKIFFMPNYLFLNKIFNPIFIKFFNKLIKSSFWNIAIKHFFRFIVTNSLCQIEFSALLPILRIIFEKLCFLPSFFEILEFRNNICFFRDCDKFLVFVVKAFVGDQKLIIRFSVNRLKSHIFSFFFKTNKFNKKKN